MDKQIQYLNDLRLKIKEIEVDINDTLAQLIQEDMIKQEALRLTSEKN